MDIRTMGAVPHRPADHGRDDVNYGKTPAAMNDKEPSPLASNERKDTQSLPSREEVSLSIDDGVTKLLYRAAIEAVKDDLAPVMSTNAMQQTYKGGANTVIQPVGAGTDQETADGIVNLAIQLFAQYQQQNTNMEFDAQLGGFMKVFVGAITRGFDEAEEILSAAREARGEQAQGLLQTRQRVDAGLQAFQDELRTGDRAQTGH